MSATLIAVTLTLLMGAPAGPGAPSLRYWGRLSDGSGRARIQYGGRLFEVRAGDRIPGWGTVRAVQERALFVRRVLTDAEKQAREAEGLPAVEALDMRIPLAAGHAATPVDAPR
jgi:hypothetical protein